MNLKYFLGIGPTEIRIYFIALNTFIIYLDPAREYFETFTHLYFCSHTRSGFIEGKSYKKIWSIDMENREKWT